MRFYIDRFYKLCGCFILKGWCEAYRPGADIDVLFSGQPLKSLTSPSPNPTLPDHFGPGTESWGFHVLGVFSDDPSISTLSVSLRFENGESIESLGSASPRLEDQEAHALFWGFVEEVRAAEGTVLELGSRARSGVSSRGTFAPARHIGLDVVAGDNVDVVGDAHQLSALIREPVDFITSISVFEHLCMPWKVVLEMNKVLEQGGKVFSQSHQAWPLHDIPHDYFRFSDQAWHSLFNIHTGFRVLQTRQGHLVSQTARYNIGPPFDTLEYGESFALSACIAEKIAEPLVSWDAPISSVQQISYGY